MTAPIILVVVLAGAVLLGGGFLLGARWGSLHFAEVASQMDAHPEDLGS